MTNDNSNNNNNNENNESENPVILEELQIWKNLIWENFSIKHLEKSNRGHDQVAALTTYVTSLLIYVLGSLVILGFHK